MHPNGLETHVRPKGHDQENATPSAANLKPVQYTLANIMYRDQAAKGHQEPRLDADAPTSSNEQEMNPLHDKDQQHFRRQSHLHRSARDRL